MKCYFCQNELKINQYHDRIGESCDYCTSTCNIYEVINFIDKDGVPIFVSIWPDKVNQVLLPAVPPLIPSRLANIGKHYGIRLNLQDNTSDILDSNQWVQDNSLIMTLPGFPINPSNARNKLKLYLLFL